MHICWKRFKQVVRTTLVIVPVVASVLISGITLYAPALATPATVVFPTPAPRTPVSTPSILPLFRPDYTATAPSIPPTTTPEPLPLPQPSAEPDPQPVTQTILTPSPDPDPAKTATMTETVPISETQQTFWLPSDVPAWYAPTENTASAVTLPAGTSYQPIARYRTDWVQADVDTYGHLWLRHHDIGPDVPISMINPLPNLAPVLTYRVHRVEPGDTLQSIATRGGSDSTLIGSLNHVHEPLLVGRPLVVPMLEAQQTSLPLFPYILSRGSGAQPRVALTVDLEVGDDRVWYLLDVLRERKTRITFFVVGWWVQQHPDIVRQIVADGHEIANHSLSHPDFRTLSNDQIRWQLAETERLVQEAAGVTTRPLYRPTYGAYNDRVLMTAIESGYIPIYWTIDVRDAVGSPKTASFVADQATGSLAPEHLPGTIILTHCCGNRHPVADAIPIMLDRFTAMGIEVGTVSEVLGE